MINDWQYTNPFYEDGYIQAAACEEVPICPWDPAKYDDPEDIARETYRMNEWLEGCGRAILKVLLDGPGYGYA